MKWCLKIFILHLLSLAVLHRSVVGDDQNDNKLLFKETEELLSIKAKFVTKMQTYLKDQIKEIDNFTLNYPLERNDLIDELKETEKWWLKDIARRDINVIDKLIELRFNKIKPFKDTDFNSFKNELNNSLEYSASFWRNEIDEKMQRIRKQGNQNYFADDDVVTTSPELKLPKHEQSVYNLQVQLITRLQKVVDLLVAVKLIRFQINDDSLKKEDIQYISENTKMDRIREKILRVQAKHYLNNLKIATVEKIKDIWRNTDNNDVTEMFNNIFKGYFNNSFGVLKKIDEISKIKWPGSKLLGLYF